MTDKKNDFDLDKLLDEIYGSDEGKEKEAVQSDTVADLFEDDADSAVSEETDIEPYTKQDDDKSESDTESVILDKFEDNKPAGGDDSAEEGEDNSDSERRKAVRHRKSTRRRHVSSSRRRKHSISARKRKELVKNSIIFIIVFSFAIVFLTPIVLTISNSFMSQSEINANYGIIFAKTERGGKEFVSEIVNLKFIPDMVSFSQYITVLFKSPDYLIKFWNSVILVVPIVVFQLAVAVFASYGFTRLKGRLKEIVFFAYIILMLMPYQVTLVPNYLVSNWLHIIDTRWAIWLPGIASPFAVYLLTKFMRRIPISYIEAAQIDGAGEWQIFKKICFPLSKSCLYSVAILVFIDYWNMVEQPLILLTDTEMHPLSVFLSQINSGETGLAFAVATIYMVPGLLVFLYGEDYLVEGIMYQGGIKG